MQPSNADALPARAPCPLMAQAEVFGKMQPRLAMQINSGTNNGHSASVRNAAIANSVNAANLLRAHALLESGKSKGKIVLEGF